MFQQITTTTKFSPLARSAVVRFVIQSQSPTGRKFFDVFKTNLDYLSASAYLVGQSLRWRG